MKKLWITAGITMLTAFCAYAGLSAQEAKHEQYVSPWKTPWDYTGPRGADHWSALDPDYAACNSGKQQSPIDIRNAEIADLPVLRFESKSGPVKYVVNNAHTIRVNYSAGNGNFLFVAGKHYELTQFHFHHPSEEYVDGMPSAMETHLVYKAHDGKVAGVTVLVTPGRATLAIQKVWEHMPKTEGGEEVSGVEMSPAALLPANTSAYYTYEGSVTAPPCTEGVTWFVLKQPAQMSRRQIAAFARLFPHDVRPVQPLNGRVVKQTR